MSSNIKIQRVCEFCGNEFTAQTTTTRYCSKKCNSRDYKKRLKAKKIAKANAEVQKGKSLPIEEIGKKSILTVKETATLLNLSLRSVYRLIENGVIKASNLGERMTRIKRNNLEEILEKIHNTPVKQRHYKLSECYTPAQVQEKYNISEKALYELLKRGDIQRIKHGMYTYIPKQLIDSFFRKPQ